MKTVVAPELARPGAQAHVPFEVKFANGNVMGLNSRWGTSMAAIHTAISKRNTTLMGYSRPLREVRSARLSALQARPKC